MNGMGSWAMMFGQPACDDKPLFDGKDHKIHSSRVSCGLDLLTAQAWNAHYSLCFPCLPMPSRASLALLKKACEVSERKLEVI